MRSDREKQKEQRELSQPQNSILDELARKALNESSEEKTKVMGFDEL